MERKPLNFFQHLKALIMGAVQDGPLLDPFRKTIGRHHCGKFGRGHSDSHNASQYERANRRHAKRAAKARRA